jgi:hypothetical protein
MEQTDQGTPNPVSESLKKGRLLSDYLVYVARDINAFSPSSAHICMTICAAVKAPAVGTLSGKISIFPIFPSQET